MSQQHGLSLQRLCWTFHPTCSSLCAFCMSSTGTTKFWAAVFKKPCWKMALSTGKPTNHLGSILIPIITCSQSVATKFLPQGLNITLLSFVSIGAILSNLICGVLLIVKVLGGLTPILYTLDCQYMYLLMRYLPIFSCINIMYLLLGHRESCVIPHHQAIEGWSPQRRRQYGRP